MKFLCLGYYDPAAFDTLSEAEQEAVARECRPHDERLRASGRMVSVASLEHRKAATVRPASGGPAVVDGPFAEAKEVIGSFFIIEADDMDEALRVASLHPAARWGEHLGFGIEVRPIEFFEQLQPEGHSRPEPYPKPTPTSADRLLGELRSEATTTRRVLERVPDDRLSWKPHPKSMSLGQLAMHAAALPQGIATLLVDLSVEVPVVPLPEARSRSEILATLERSVAAAAEKLAGWGDAGLAAEWTLTSGDAVLAVQPRAEVVRTLMLNHWYHHRGQLTVYLRLLGVPLPPVYGPTADEDLSGALRQAR